MKSKQPHSIYLLLLICFFTVDLVAQSESVNVAPTNLDFVKKVQMSKEKMQFVFEQPYKDFTVEIAGPDDFYVKEDFKDVNDLNLRSSGILKETFTDGGYNIQITPIFFSTEKEQKIMRYYMATNERDKLKAMKALKNIPDEVVKYTRHITIKDGAFVLPQRENYGLKLPTDNAVVSKFKTIRLFDQQNPTFTGLSLNNNIPKPTFVDQQILDDLIVDGSACIGQDCVNGESFGFDTIRIKENNLRFRAQDTSVSASFPTRDWQLTFNDSANGGANKFSIDDIDGGRTPFTIEGNAPSHSLYVDDGGRLGLGTSTPVVDIHVKSGNTPTNRLEQDGSSGFSAQTWDVAGNEANFFIRDATNGSTLPFRIFPGAPSDAMNIEASGDIGFGVTGPLGDFQVTRTDDIAIALNCGDGRQAQFFYLEGANSLSSIRWVEGMDDNTDHTYKIDRFGDTGASDFLGTPFSIQRSNGYVGVGVNPALVQFQVGTAGDGSTAEANFWNTLSDRRLKRDISPLPNALDKILALNGYFYYWKKGKKDQSRQVGVIAQEVAEVLPEIVHENDGGFIAVDYSKLTAVLIEAVKTQNEEIKVQKEKISTLEAQVVKLKNLENQVIELAKLVQKTQKIENTSTDAEKK